MKSVLRRMTRRRGASAVQTGLVLALIAAAAFVGLNSLNSSTNTELNQTASGVADPAKLAQQFTK